MKSVLRKLYAPLYRTFRRKQVQSVRFSWAGQPLNSGITGCLTVKNEELTLQYTLPTFLEFFDQIICIDNGSTDGSLEILRKFEDDYGNRLDISVISMPEASFVEAKNEGLRQVKFQWFCVLDADMYLLPKMIAQRPEFIETLIPSAVRCPRIMPGGDLGHANYSFPLVSRGEYFLRHFNSEIRFIEVNKRNTHAIIPRYYRFIENQQPLILDLDCAKPNERRLFRSCRMDYRQHLNSGGDEILFKEFEDRWLAHLLGTREPESRKYRASRLVASFSRKLTAEEQAILDSLNVSLPGFPFEVIEETGKPFLRVDHRDDFWTIYHPTQADRDYEPPHHKFHDIAWRLSPFGNRQ